MPIPGRLAPRTSSPVEPTAPSRLVRVLVGASIAVACHGDDRPPRADAGSTGEGSTTTPMPTSADDTTGREGSTTDADSGNTGPLPPAGSAQFEITVENISQTGLMMSPLSPGLWVNHAPTDGPLFDVWQPDDEEGLEALAEDGDPTALAAALATHAGVQAVGIFDTPVGADEPGLLLPGDRYRFSLTASPTTRLSLALMVSGSNDAFIASSPEGISLFDGGGQPMAARDVTGLLQVWDAGTEQDQAPGQGPWQALHGGSPDLGLPETLDLSVVHPHQSSTRAIPLGPDLVTVTVTEDPERPGAWILNLTNTSAVRGTLVTSLSSLVWARHDDSVTLFTEGDPAPAPLEALAEDGDAALYDAMLAGMAGVVEYGVILGPIVPGQTVALPLPADATDQRLSLATMLMQSNDAFLALGPQGLPLDDGDGRIDPESLTAAIAAHLTPWDAGTEANEVPGAGPHQLPRQAAPDTGPPEMDDPTVHRYADATDDLAGDGAGGVLAVAVAEQGGEYTLTLTNISDTTAFSGLVPEVVWAVHDGSAIMFEPGTTASPGLRTLAEDGQAFGLFTELAIQPGVSMVAEADTPVGAMFSAPLAPGDSYAFTAIPDAAHRYLVFAGMLVPSNDTFLALDPPGVALLDATGIPRSAAAVEADIATALRAWDAGTEGNQAGAAGADMTPNGFPGFGPGHGSGFVRPASDNEIWSMPRADGLVRVMVAPMER